MSGNATQTLSRHWKLTFADWPVSLKKVWLQVDFKQVASNTLYCVIYWKDMNPLSILHIRTWLNAEEKFYGTLNDI